MSETQIEKYLIKQVKEIGGKALKMIPTYENGIPDRQVLYRGASYFIELKKEGRTARPLQIEYMRELSRMGFNCRVIASKKEVDEFIKEIR